MSRSSTKVIGSRSRSHEQNDRTSTTECTHWQVVWLWLKKAVLLETVRWKRWSFDSMLVFNDWLWRPSNLMADCLASTLCQFIRSALFTESTQRYDAVVRCHWRQHQHQQHHHQRYAILSSVLKADFTPRTSTIRSRSYEESL